MQNIRGWKNKQTTNNISSAPIQIGKQTSIGFYNNPEIVKKAEKPPLIPLETATEKFKLIMSSRVMDKVRYLCDKIPTREWSGVVFYDHAGDINDIPNLEVTAIDLYPLDIGTAGYTEFTYTPDFAGYMATNPELMSASMGLIHSHNSMGVFFSGTDTNTLREQAPIYKTFLSVIVNNNLEVEAAMSVESKRLVNSSTAFQGLDKNVVTVNTTREEIVAIRYNCEIVKALETDTEFEKIVASLMEDSTKHSYKTRSSITTSNTNGYGAWYGGNTGKSRHEGAVYQGSGHRRPVQEEYLPEKKEEDKVELDSTENTLEAIFAPAAMDSFVCTVILEVLKRRGIAVALTNNISPEVAFNMIPRNCDSDDLEDEFSELVSEMLANYKWDSYYCALFLNKVLDRISEYLEEFPTLNDNFFFPTFEEALLGNYWGYMEDEDEEDDAIPTREDDIIKDIANDSSNPFNVATRGLLNNTLELTNLNINK